MATFGAHRRITERRTGRDVTVHGQIAAQLPNVTFAQGAIAVVAGGHTIAGLGVSGAPGGHLDEECARGALAKVRDRIK